MSLSANNKKTLFVLLSIFILLSIHNIAFAEPEYDAQGELIPQGAEKRQGTIDQIIPERDGSAIILINDTPHRATSATKYITSYNSSSSLSAFAVGQFIGFYHIDSLITKMWPEKDPEETTTKTAVPPSPKVAPGDTGIIKDNGVWKN